MIDQCEALNMRQVNQLRAMSDPDQANILAIAWSTRKTPDEVALWYDSVPAGEVEACVVRVFEVSKMTEAAKFPG